MVYIERAAGKPKLDSLDKGFLDVIASQISLGFSGILLREKYIHQNFELRKLAVLKGNFIGHLSADLQRPMEMIISLLQKRTDEDLQEALDDVILLKKGIDKIISIFSLQQEVDEMYIHAILINTIIEKVTAAYQDEIEKRKLEIQFHYPEKLQPFSGNQDTIHTIIDEVICNAIVYNNISGKLDISVEQDDRNCRIIIQDTGVGIGQDKLTKVFERFYRAPTSAELHDRGAGLGLYIVREFMEAYGGSIVLTSDEGVGSKVILNFPMWHTGASGIIFS
jgi:two-component system phosphate regulon sensor histidine kinase PhoR